MKYLLDTNICIYIINHKPEKVRQKFATILNGDVGISSITVAELAFGAEKSHRTMQNLISLRQFLTPLQTIQFDADDAYAYGKLRSMLAAKGQPVGSMDMLIAAQGLARGLTIVSNNVREFQRVETLSLEDWTLPALSA